MAVTFEMVGKLSVGKDSDKFKSYEEIKYDSGWINRTLKFNVTSGDSRFMLQIKGGCFEDQHNDIYVFSKDGVDDEGKRVKGEGFTIPFKERLKHPRLAEVAEWKKFVIDLEEPGRRWKLQNAAERLKEGKEFNDVELRELGVGSAEEIPTAYEKSCKKRKEFISEWDYAEFIKKMIDSGKYANKKFKIRGEHQYQYSEQNKRFYSNFVPTRIYLAEDDAIETATENAIVYFNSESLEDVSEEKGKYYVNAKIFVYDSNRKSNIPCDYMITFNATPADADERTKKMVNAKVKMFTIDSDEWRELGVVNTLIDGAERMAIEFDDLTEEQQDNILMGLTTLEDIRAEMGGSVYGDRIQEARFTKLAKGYSGGSKDSVYTDEDFEIKPIGADEEEDLFDEEDDDDLF